MRVNVQNGTRAGWRIVNAAVRKDWKCPTCGARLRYFWQSCPNDGHPRP
jgi:predicted RNA-binding Zn-ribbon protein involved in translation (DUF1610 family)